MDVTVYLLFFFFASNLILYPARSQPAFFSVNEAKGDLGVITHFRQRRRKILDLPKWVRAVFK